VETRRKAIKQGRRDVYGLVTERSDANLKALQKEKKSEETQE
jgi:hypothetical protein